MTELARRQVEASCAAVGQPADTIRARDAFLDQHSGWWVVNFMNEHLPDRAMVPALRLLKFFQARSRAPKHIAGAKREAEEWVKLLAKDGRIFSKPWLLPANEPTVIPHSEASALDADHILGKLRRNLTRAAEIVKLRQADFRRHHAENADHTHEEGAVGLSEYHRRKLHLTRKRTLHLDGPTAPAAVGDGDEMTAADSLRLSAKQGRRNLDVLRELVGQDGGRHPTAATDPHEAAPAPLGDIGQGGCEAAADVPAATAAAVAEEAVVPCTVGPPPPILCADEIPEKWRVEHARIEDWPADLQTRDKVANITVVEDLDVPEDAPKYPDAAGMEWIVLVYGGTHSKGKVGIAAAKSIGTFMQDVPVSTVELYVPLFPTEVDEDKIGVGHQTGNPRMNAELDKIMNRRTVQLEEAAQANVAHAAGVPIRITRPNAIEAIPDLDDMHTIMDAANPVTVRAVDTDAASGMTATSVLTAPTL